MEQFYPENFDNHTYDKIQMDLHVMSGFSDIDETSRKISNI